MKKLMVLFVVLVVAFALPTMAQTWLGPVVGVNLANVSVEEDEEGVDYGMLTGFAFGGVASFGLSEMMSLQLEPTYMQKGSNIEIEGFGDAKLKLAYIDIPVLLKIAFGQSNVKPYALVGGNIGFLMSAKLEDEDVKDDAESLDYGLNFGAGVSIPMGTNNFFIEAQYALGLADITKPIEVTGADDIDTSDKNTGIQIKAGIMFPLGGQ